MKEEKEEEGAMKEGGKEDGGNAEDVKMHFEYEREIWKPRDIARLKNERKRSDPSAWTGPIS